MVYWLNFRHPKVKGHCFIGRERSKLGFKQRISHVIGKSIAPILKLVNMPILQIMMGYWLNFWLPKVKGHCFIGHKRSNLDLKQRISHIIGKSAAPMLKPADMPIHQIMMGYWLNFRHLKVKGHCFIGHKRSKSDLKQRISHVIGKSTAPMLKPVHTPIHQIMMGYWFNFRHPKVKGHCFIGHKRSKSGLKRRISHVIGKSTAPMLEPVDRNILQILMGYWLYFQHPQVKGHRFLGRKMSKLAYLARNRQKYCMNLQASLQAYSADYDGLLIKFSPSKGQRS